MSAPSTTLNHRVPSSKSSLADNKDNDWSDSTEKAGATTNGLSVFDDPLLAK